MTDEVQFLDNRARFHATSADTGDYALIESVAPARSQPPLHVHRDESEGFAADHGIDILGPPGMLPAELAA
jgi:hypothetical protein